MLLVKVWNIYEVGNVKEIDPTSVTGRAENNSLQLSRCLDRKEHVRFSLTYMSGFFYFIVFD